MAAAPEETTILRLRHLLEEQDLGGAMLDTVNCHLADKGISVTTWHYLGCVDYPRAQFDQAPDW
jgi:hypothetical protein